MNQEKLIQIKNLKTFFNTEAGIAKAVNDVSFDKIIAFIIITVILIYIRNNILNREILSFVVF